MPIFMVMNETSHPLLMFLHVHEPKIISMWVQCRVLCIILVLLLSYYVLLKYRLHSQTSSKATQKVLTSFNPQLTVDCNYYLAILSEMKWQFNRSIVTTEYVKMHEVNWFSKVRLPTEMLQAKTGPWMWKQYSWDLCQQSALLCAGQTLQGNLWICNMLSFF